MSPTTEPDVATLRHWYAADPDGVAGELGIDRDVGLSVTEAAARLQRDGPNELPTQERPSPIRREGKAESAMNALKSMMQMTARVRRDAPSRRSRPGRAGRGRRRADHCRGLGARRRADRRGELAPDDDSTPTGESVPASKDAQTLADGEACTASTPGTRCS